MRGERGLQGLKKMCILGIDVCMRPYHMPQLFVKYCTMAPATQPL